MASLCFETSSLAYQCLVLNFVLQDVALVSSAITDLVRRSSSLPSTYLLIALGSRVAGLFEARNIACPSSVLTFDDS